MKTINIHQTKTHLSKLVAEASQGERFIIAEAGKPVVKVIALNAPAAGEVRRLGFVAGRISVADDFDQMGRRKSNVSSQVRNETLTGEARHVVGGRPTRAAVCEGAALAQGRAESVAV